MYRRSYYKLDWSPEGIGRRIINGSRQDKSCFFWIRNMISSRIFFNRLITDFEPMALRLSDSWRRRRVRPKHKSDWYLKFKKSVFKKICNLLVICNRGSWISMRSYGIGVEEWYKLKTLLCATSKLHFKSLKFHTYHFFMKWNHLKGSEVKIFGISKKKHPIEQFCIV